MEYLSIIFSETYKILFLLVPVLVSVAMIVWLDRRIWDGVAHELDGAAEAGFHRFLALWRRVAYGEFNFDFSEVNSVF